MISYIGGGSSTLASPEYSRCDSISKLASKTGTKDDISAKIGKKKIE